MLSFDQLNDPPSDAELEQQIIDRLDELGFASKGWQSGSAQLTIGVKLPAWLYAKFAQMVRTVLRSGFNDTAEGDFLTRFSKSVYQNTRKPAVAARYTVRHTVAVGEGPHTIDVGDLSATNGTHVYSNIDDGSIAYPVVLSSAAPVDITYEAEKPGAGANTADGTITQLITTVAGLTITNPRPSQLVAGANEEADDGPAGGSTGGIRLRNSTRWVTLAIDMPADGYKNIALGVSGVGRVAVDAQNPRGPGTVDVYIAGNDAPAGPTDVTNCQTAIDARRSITANVLVILPSNQTIVVSGIVYVAPAYLTGAQAKVEQAVRDYINVIQIGGDELDGLTWGVAEDAIKAAIRAVPGVKNVDLTAPLTDFVMNPYGLAVADVTGLVVQRL